jgi:heat shock protein HslJ
MRSILLALALAACATAPVADAQSVSPGAWTLAHLDGAPEGVTRLPTLTIEDRRAVGSTGCNRWFASVDRSDGGVRFGIIGASKMACIDNHAMAMEQTFLAALARVRDTRTDGDQLVLTGENATEVMRFNRTE